MAKREAIGASFPQAAVLTWIVDLIGFLLDFVVAEGSQSRRADAQRSLPGRGRQAGMKALEDFGAGDTRRSLRAGGATGSTSCLFAVI
ncbi:hypothetical protein EB815_31645 [Mesorhizobium loti]|nr:hypothetical protein EB815_31645 [Mesorhizobium loti]